MIFRVLDKCCDYNSETEHGLQTDRLELAKALRGANISTVVQFKNISICTPIEGVSAIDRQEIQRTIDYNYVCASSPQSVRNMLETLVEKLDPDTKSNGLTETDLPFKGRQDTAQKIVEACIDILAARSYDKMKRKLLHIIGMSVSHYLQLLAAPGVGKSRLVMELIECMKSYLDSLHERTADETKFRAQLENSVSVFTTLANGTHPVWLDYHNPLHALCYRMFYSHFVTKRNKV